MEGSPLPPSPAVSSINSISLEAELAEEGFVNEDVNLQPPSSPVVNVSPTVESPEGSPQSPSLLLNHQPANSPTVSSISSYSGSSLPASPLSDDSDEYVGPQGRDTYLPPEAFVHIGQSMSSVGTACMRVPLPTMKKARMQQLLLVEPQLHGARRSEWSSGGSMNIKITMGQYSDWIFRQSSHMTMDELRCARDQAVHQLAFLSAYMQDHLSDYSDGLIPIPDDHENDMAELIYDSSDDSALESSSSSSDRF